MRNKVILRLRASAAAKLAPRGFIVTAALAGSLGLWGGCAEERDPINRVQADALAKSFFVGANLQSAEDDPEFYKRGTVVDVGYGAGQSGLFTSTYAQPVSRIRWEISEKTLNARLAYERIRGTDGKGNARNGVEHKPTNDGQIVASYEIESHFDIRRDYNPQTGEELNIVVENTDDRPWYAREYFRVDWSKNLITDSYDFDTLSSLGVIGGVKYDAFAYTVLDPQNPDAPHFDAAAGYFDVTNKAYATPQIVDLSGLDAGVEKYPACMLSSYFEGGTEPWGNCGPIEITIRESYRRVGKSDYEPADHDGLRFQVLGGFNFDYRRSYERNYGILDRDWMRFLARYDIWERSHYYADSDKMTGPIVCATKATTEDPTGDPSADPNRDDDGDGTADECAGAGVGAHCDVFTQKCALPYRQRKPKTIPWYIAGDTSLFEATNWAVLEWDLALKTAIQTARLTECRRLGGGGECSSLIAMWTGQQEDNDEAVRIARDVDACRRKDGFSAASCIELARSSGAAVAAERGTPDDPSSLAIGTVTAMDPVVVLCHNPVTSGDHAACGKPGTTARLGDLRYNIVLNVEQPQTPSPWGIMVDGNDPLTGEKVAGSMNVWTHVTDLAAQQLVDLVRYANGELTTEQITNGSYVRDWAAATRLSSGAGLPLMSSSEVVTRLAGGTKLDPAAFEALTKNPPLPQIQKVLATGKGRVLDVQARSDVASPGNAKLRATINRGRGSAVEAALVNPAILQLAGKSSAAAGDIGNTSPLVLNQPRLSGRLRQARENALAARGACIVNEAPEPTSLSGLADILRQKFPPSGGESALDRQARHERMFRYVQQHYHYAILAHEMGHSIGLRHNFVSSSAPLFYRPQYWQLRTQNGAVKTPCTEAAADGASCVGPRYWDPVTTEEQSQLITMWMQSSVMDYAGDPAQDFLGLGITDFAAARFFYGDVVSVYTSPDYRARTPIGTGITSATDTFGGLLGIRYGLKSTSSTGVDEFNYAQLQNNYKVITDCKPVSPVPPADWDEAKRGKWNAVLDGHIVSVGGQATKCRQQPVDYMPYTALRMPTAAEHNNGFYRGSPSVDGATGRLRVPYAFGTDTWADIGNVSVLRHDNGADPYEQVQFLISTQENRHIFDNYRRDRTTFSVRGAADRSFDRYNAKLQAIAGGMGFLQSIYEDLSTTQGYAFDSVWPVIVKDVVHDNMIAATVAFDHFTRELARPEPGEHGLRPIEFKDPVLHSLTDPDDFGGGPVNIGRNVIIPNGSTGYLRDVGFGGHPLENRLPDNAGEFRVDYVQNAGSYYDKINVATLLAESEDRFVSESRRDFYDSRFRAVGVADVLGEGFRRLIANALTGDRSILAPRVAADANGLPLLDTRADTSRDPLANRYPAQPIGWPSFWPRGGPETCFSSGGRNTCTNYAGDGGFDPATPQSSVAVDPQIGWEVQKFLIVWTVTHIKANEKSNWTDMMRLYPVGLNTKPEFEPRIEWQDPISGQLYYARTYGKECLYGDAKNGCQGGKLVQKGIAARVLEYAGELTGKGYKLDEAKYPSTGGNPAGFNAYGRPMILHHPDGNPIVLADPAIKNLSPTGDTLTPIPDCDQNLDPTCVQVVVSQNHFAHELKNYKTLPDYLYQAGVVYGLFDPPGKLGGAN